MILFQLLLSTGMTSLLSAAQWEFPSAGIQEIQVRAKAAKILVKQAVGASVRVSIVGPKEMSWSQELKAIDGVTIKTLYITGPEDSLVVGDSFLTIELPKEILSTKLVFEEVRAELQSVSQVQVSALKGQIIGNNTGEGIHYNLQKGDIQSFQHKGSLEIESYGGKILVKDGQGNLKVQLFSGDLTIEKNQGRIQLESQSSVARIKEQQGVVSLQWGRGSLSLSDFSGRLEGASTEGQLQLQLKPESIVDLQAGRGKVNVSLPSGSGASLNLKTITGDLSVPSPLKAGREGKFRIARGKLSGALKGSVSIHAEDASISVK